MGQRLKYTILKLSRKVEESPNIFFLSCFLILLVCGAVAVLGRIIGNVFYSLGQILQLLGALGGGVAVAGIGIFELLYPGQDILTRWKPIPTSIRQIIGRSVGVVFLLIAILIILKAVLGTFRILIF